MSKAQILVCPIILSIFLFLSVDKAFSLDPKKAISQFSADVWQTKDGLPESHVQAILQTRDGYLWIGTEEGVARFDGVRFTVFDKGNTEAIKANSVSALCEDSDGNLWIGTEAGVVRFRNGQFTLYAVSDGLPNGVVRSMCASHDGGIWVGTAGGLARLSTSSEKEAHVVSFTSKDGMSNDYVWSLNEDSDRTLWIGTGGGGLNRFKDGKFTAFTTKEGLSHNTVRAICLDRSGVLWIGTASGLSRFKDGKWSTFSVKDGLSNDFVRTLFQDRQGSLWIGTVGGINRFYNGQFTSYTTKEGLVNNIVECFFEDREGSLWIGTNGGGLQRLKEGKFTVFTTTEGLVGNTVWTVLEDHKSTLWIGTQDGLSKFENGQVVTYTTKDGLSNNIVLSLAESKDGSLWVGTGAGGLNRFKDGRFSVYTTKDGLANDDVRSIYEDREGDLWVGTMGGLNRFSAHNGKDRRVTSYTTKDGLSHNSIPCLYQDREGTIWIGTDGGGLNRFRDGTFTNYGMADGLSANKVFSIVEDDEGTLLLGTNGGLIQFSVKGAVPVGEQVAASVGKNGRFTACTMKQGMYDDMVLTILKDDGGNLWLTCNKGVSQISKKELDNYFQGKSDHVASTVYTMADGLKSNEFSGAVYPSAWKSSNGKLWFGTYQGLAVVDPGKIKDNALPPSVFIEQVFIDKRSINISDNVQLPAGVGELEFHYAGLSFLVPGKVKFKYKLEGFNQTWVDAGTRRVAYYTNIPPASYRFRVIACNNDGLWNEAGTSFEFSLAPHFYKTRWFYGLCVLAVILAGASVHRFRVAKLKTRERELTHRVNERTEEIHKLNGELEDRVMERTAELRDVNAELQKDIAERKRAEEALRQSEERFRTIYESSPIGIASIGISGKFIQVNSAFEKLIGYSEAELRSMSFISITYPDDVGESTEVFKQLVENRRDRAEFEKRYIQKNGQVIWTHLTLSVARDAHGNLLHTVTMIEDITERKHAEEEVRKQLAELQRWHVLTLDREDRVQALKQEINELLIRLSEPIRYPSQARASRDTELKQRG